MSDTDGKIQLAVDLSPEDAKKSAQKLQKNIQGIFNQTSGQKLDNQFQKMLSNMSKAISRSESLQKSLDKVSNQQIETKEYTKLQREITSLIEKIDIAKTKQAQFLESGGKESSRTYENMNYNIAQMEDKLFDAQRELEHMVAEGRQFTLNEPAIESAKNALADSNNQLRMMIEAAAAYQGKQSEIAQQHAQEVDAQAQEIAKLLEIKLNAGEINGEIAGTIERLREVNEELAQLQARQTELEAAGAGLGYSEYDENLSKIRELTEEQGRLNERVAEYRQEQEEAGESATVWDRVRNLFSQLGYDLAHPIQRIRELRENTESAGDSASRSNSAFGKLASTVARLAGSFITSVSGIKRFTSAISSAASKSNGASFSFKKLFTTLLRYGIGIRSIYALFNKIRNAITENIKYFALMDNGMNQTNYAISAMQSSLNALKGALAGAFVPIINVVSPILSNLIDQLASVITAIGMFIAKLTGAKSYLKAVKKSTNYAAGLSSGGSSSDKKTAEERYQEAVEKAQKKYEEQLAKVREKNAKAQAKAEEKQAKAAEKLAKQQEKANKQLGVYDKLNVLNTEDLEELEEIQAEVYEEPELELPDMSDYVDALTGGGGSEAPFGFEEVPLDDWEFNWDELKDKAEQLGRDLADKLNNFFADEDFAKNLGHNIAEALNTALHFAYGFIDQLDWRQMGHWLGTLVQEGLDTFEWDLLGKTVGEALNGIADAILGFFERYNAGTLGHHLSEALNAAIEAIDPVKLGTALNEVLKDPFIELSAFFTETNWRLLGSKFTTFFHNALTSDALNGKSLGYTIGQTLADAVNAGIQLLLGADIRTAVNDLVTFFGDMFRAALINIDWADLFEAVWHVIIGTLTGLLQGVVTFLVDLILDLIEAAIPEMTGKIEQARSEIHGELEAAFADAEAFFTGAADLAETETERMTSAMAVMNDYVAEFPSSFADWGEALQNIQQEYQLTDDAMQALIDKIIISNDYVDETSELLKYGEDGWYSYKSSIEETTAVVGDAKSKQEDLDSSIKGVGDTAAETGDKVKDYVKIASDEMTSGKQNADDYNKNVTDNLQGISDKSKDVEMDFSSMTEQINAELESLTTLVDEWYQNLLAQYFSYDNWYAMLQQGILMAMNNFITVDFYNNWDVNIKVWWETHVKPWFSADKWNNEIFTPWRTNAESKWNELMSWYDQKIEDWWKKTQKYFEESKWSNEFNKVKNTAENSFREVEQTITNHINAAKEAVLAACEEMKAAIAAVKAEMEALNSMRGSGGYRTTSGGTGWHSATGGSSGGRYSGFMPMLDIMHFEDNLGMSAFKFPELATGAVIPPNNRFLAVLGDQKSGTNIETPLDTMVEAFNRALDQRSSSNHEPIVLQLEGEVIAQAVWDEEEKRYKQLGDFEPLYS